MISIMQFLIYFNITLKKHFYVIFSSFKINNLIKKIIKN